MIRRKLVALILLVVAGVTGIAGSLIVSTLHGRLLAQVDDELAARSNAVAPAPGLGRRPPPDAGETLGEGGPGSNSGQPPSPFDVRRYAFVDLDSSGRVIGSVPTGPADDPEPLPDVAGLKGPLGPITVGSVGHSGLHYRVILIAQPDGGAVAAGLPLADVEKTVNTARDIVWLACILAVATAGVIVWFTVRHSLRPIDTMIGTAERIAAGDLSERATVPQPTSEVGHLGTALNVMLDRIEEAVDAKTASEARTRRFAADASHELRTPLTSIRGYAELYRQGADSPADVAKAMARIEHEAVRMGVLVEDLLLLARLDQGRPLENVPVDLTGLVVEAVAAAKAVEPERPLTLQLADEPLTVVGDPLRLRQVVDNLLANVRQHTAPGTPATVRLAAPATLVVADEGQGMSPDDAAHAFDRFWQASGDTHSGRGTGLGLAIVAEIVAAQGGTVALDTAPGKGAAFTVKLRNTEARSLVETSS